MSCGAERQAWLEADQKVQDEAAKRDQNKVELDAAQVAYDESVIATDQAAIDAGAAYRDYLACVTGQEPAPTPPPEPTVRR